MSVNRAKKFEKIILSCWEETVGTWIYRLYDVMNGNKGVRNISDFLAYKMPIMYVIEAKSIQKNTFPCNFRQYEDMKELYDKHIQGIEIGVIVWFIDHQKVVYISIETFIKLVEDGKKSFNIKMLESNEYDHIVIDSVIQRVYPLLDFKSFVKKIEEKHSC